METGTPHQYGNEIWGGIEFSHVTGSEDAKESQRTYIDYDPVTGRAIRSALRQQVRTAELDYRGAITVFNRTASFFCCR